MYLLGIDIGTTSVKAAVFNVKGEICGYGFMEYEIIFGDNGIAEQDAENIWACTKKVIKDASKTYGNDIKAISLSTQGDAIIPIDKNCNPIYNAQLGMDYRCIEESEFIGNKFGDKFLFEKTGMRPHPLNSICKILWFKNNRKDIYNKTYKFTTYQDFILRKLGSDNYFIDKSMASRTMAYDIKLNEWSSEILDSLNIDNNLFSKVCESGSCVGKISSSVAFETGINPNAILVSGGHDQPCAALGAGITSTGIALDSHGTAEVLSTILPILSLDDNMYNNYYPCYCNVLTNSYFTFALNHTAGILFKWFRDTLGYEDVVNSNSKNISSFDEIVNNLSDKLSPLYVLPHFNGSGTPTFDLKSKGAILGLTLSSTRHDIARAILEALAFELKINIESFEKAGIIVKELRCVGGGASSDFSLQLKADILQLPVVTLKNRESACFGAAILAGIGFGIFNKIDDIEKIILTDKVYFPRKNELENINKKYYIYKQLYDTLKKINDSI